MAKPKMVPASARAQKLQNDVCREFGRWKSNEISEKEYAEYLCNAMENYIKFRIAVGHRTLGAEYDDLIQQGRLAVLKEVERYDPNKSMLTSYFTQRVDAALKEICDTGASTKYYVSNASKLQDAAKVAGIALPITEIKPDTLAVIAGMSISTVMQTLEQIGRTKCSLDEVGDSFDGRKFQSPEEAIVEQERNQFVQGLFDECTPLERYLIREKFLGDKEGNYRTIVANLRKPEIAEKYRDELGGRKVDQGFVKKTIARVLHRMKAATKTRKFMGEDPKKTWDRPVMELRPEDIDDIPGNIDDLFGDDEN